MFIRTESKCTYVRCKCKLVDLQDTASLGYWCYCKCKLVDLQDTVLRVNF